MRSKREHYWIRTAVQAGFAAWCVLVGLKFHRFVLWVRGEIDVAEIVRPPGVEAFLPISSLMGLVRLVKTGTVDRVHPAGVVILAMVFLFTLAMGRGFCSWVCPFSLGSEALWKWTRRLLGRSLLPPMWIDIPLRGLRYLLLGLFLFVILGMSGEALVAFAESDYNRVADLKMYLLFADISRTALTATILLAILSAFIPNFWCRYLCPYGALLGIVSLLSPVAIRRDEGQCVNCGRCAKACPNRIKVDEKSVVHSVECILCYSCVKRCGRRKALRAGLHCTQRAIPQIVYGAIVVGAFLMIPFLARSFGYWDSNTRPETYRELSPRISELGHPSMDSMQGGSSSHN